MDGFSYTNIFDTKGIEYLIVIAFLILIIPVWMIINRPLAVRSRIRETAGVLSERILRIPQGIFFSRYHTWAFLQASGTARIGADDLLAHLTGDVRVETLHYPGDRVNRGEVFARLVREDRKLELAAPVSGKITSTNQSLMNDPGAMNKDPSLSSWICEIEPEKWREETGNCFLADEASTWIRKELERVREYVLQVVGSGNKLQPVVTILQEGGELADHPLSEMPPEIWLDFQSCFLK